METWTKTVTNTEGNVVYSDGTWNIHILSKGPKFKVVSTNGGLRYFDNRYEADMVSTGKDISLMALEIKPFEVEAANALIRFLEATPLFNSM